MNIEKLYKSVAPKLTNWLVASGSDYHEACDLVQSTFLKIWNMRDDLHDDEESVSGLAFTIARNLRKNLACDNARLTFVDEIREDETLNCAVALKRPLRSCRPSFVRPIRSSRSAKCRYARSQIRQE